MIPMTFLQGKGYGRKLAMASLEFAQELNCPMKLEVHSQNIPTVNLYRSLGFEVFEDYQIYMILEPEKSQRIASGNCERAIQ